MKSTKTRNSRERGFITAKTVLMTTVSIVATASVSVIAMTSFSSSITIPKASSESFSEGVCVTAVMIERPEVQNQAGYCTKETTPENPEPILPPDPTEEPTTPPEQTEEPTLPPNPTLPPEPIVPPGPVIDYEQIMVTTWDTTATNCQQITLPIKTSINGTVTWGKNASPIDLVPSNNMSPTLSSNQLVEVTIKGVFNEWGSATWSDSNCLVSVDRWGETGTTSLLYAFRNADNLKHVDAIPSTTKNMVYAFSNIDSDFTLGKLNTSQVTDMQSLFENSTKFNQPLKFNTENLTKMAGMFWKAASFNSPIEFSDTSKVTHMNSMFQGATKFDQPINFDTSSVVEISSMFTQAESFNHPVNFNTSNVTNMSSMFYKAKTFNQPINFDTKNVTSLSSFLGDATAFNSPVTFTNTSKVTNIFQMLQRVPLFNYELKMDTSSVTDARGVFQGATSFSQDLSGWNVNKVIPFYYTNFSTSSGLTPAQLPKWK